MSEIICEDLAHRAGFATSVGNWITPEGELILGTNYDDHHWETIVDYLGAEPKTNNRLAYMNNKVGEGYIRLVFRADVLFQVGCENKDELWGNDPQYKSMQTILQKLGNTDVHVFSRTFYVIGKACDIFYKNMDKLQIRE